MFQDASNGQLEKWKALYVVGETRISGEPDNVSLITEKSWIERIPELFFKLLPDKVEITPFL